MVVAGEGGRYDGITPACGFGDDGVFDVIGGGGEAGFGVGVGEDAAIC